MKENKDQNFKKTNLYVYPFSFLADNHLDFD